MIENEKPYTADPNCNQENKFPSPDLEQRYWQYTIDDLIQLQNDFKEVPHLIQQGQVFLAGKKFSETCGYLSDLIENCFTKKSYWEKK